VPVRFRTYVNLLSLLCLSHQGKLSKYLHQFGSAGYSHKPEEYASIQDIANGIKVLALTLAKLSLQ
jgi:acetylornithine deacetylase/succinyl-diaminopimelate desuccinylase-like protein